MEENGTIKQQIQRKQSQKEKQRQQQMQQEKQDITSMDGNVKDQEVEQTLLQKYSQWEQKMQK